MLNMLGRLIPPCFFVVVTYAHTVRKKYGLFAQFWLTCAAVGGKLLKTHIQRGDENQYIPEDPARELPAGARQ